MEPWRGVCKVKTVFVRIWRHYLSLSPCCHLHWGGEQGWKSQWEVTRPLEWLVPWLPVCVSGAGEGPALMVHVKCCSCSGKPFGGFLHSHTFTYPITHQREHRFTKGLVLVKNCYGSFIHSAKLGTTQILPLRRKQINKFWYIYTVGHYSAVRENCVYSATWMNLKSLMLSEKRPDTNKYVLCDFILMRFMIR